MEKGKVIFLGKGELVITANSNKGSYSQIGKRTIKGKGYSVVELLSNRKDTFIVRDSLVNSVIRFFFSNVITERDIRLNKGIINNTTYGLTFKFFNGREVNKAIHISSLDKTNRDGNENLKSVLLSKNVIMFSHSGAYNQAEEKFKNKSNYIDVDTYVYKR